MKPLWAIQKNLIRAERFFALRNACRDLGYPYMSFRSYPDIEELPNVTNKRSVIFGASTFVARRVHDAQKWFPGVFFDHDNFTYSKCCEMYGNEMLNVDSGNVEFMTMGEFRSRDYDPNRKFFIRPDKDLKEFTGLVVEHREITEWNPDVDEKRDYATLETEIAVADPVDIVSEARFFIVDGKVSSASQYKQDGEFQIERLDDPHDIEAVEDMVSIWAPADVFAMDVAYYDHEMFILECNCFNCSGFYASDVSKIVEDVSNFVEKTVDKRVKEVQEQLANTPNDPNETIITQATFRGYHDD